MSSPANTPLLAGIMGILDNPAPYGTSPVPTTGINWANIIGSFGTSGINSQTVGSAAAAIGSMFGPIGAAVGGLASIVPGLDGFLQNGYDFTCLGAQGYSKSDLDKDLQSLDYWTKQMNPNDIASVEHWVNKLEWCIAVSDRAISQYRSGCSKSLRGKYKEACSSLKQQILNSFTVVGTTSKTESSSEGSVTYNYVKLAAGGSTPVQTSYNIPDAISESQKSQIEEKIQELALQQNISFDEAKQAVLTQTFGGNPPKWWVSIGDNGNGTEYDAGVSNKSPNYLGYGILAVGAYFAYKMISKK